MSKSALKILETAETLFNQHSFVSVGVDFIRDHSGCSKTTLYTYYKNKQQLIIAVLKNRDLLFRKRLSHFIGDKTGIQALNALFQWHLNWFQTDDFKGCLFIRAVAESNPDELEIFHIAQQHKVWLKQLILQYCQDFKHAQAISELYFNTLEALISRFLVDGFNLQTAQQSKQTLDLCITALQSLATSTDTK